MQIPKCIFLNLFCQHVERSILQRSIFLRLSILSPINENSTDFPLQDGGKSVIIEASDSLTMILLTGENKMDDLTLRKTVAENLVYYRRKKGLTQLALAETLNYSDKSISKWERGEGLPDLTVLYRLAEYYGITLNDLVSQRSEEEATEAAGEAERDTAEVSMRSRILVPVLSIGLVWLAAMVGFFLLEILPFEFAYSHLLFIYAIPISCVVALVFSCVTLTLDAPTPLPLSSISFGRDRRLSLPP